MTTQSSIFGDAFLGAIRQAVREEIQAVGNGSKESALLTAEELAVQPAEELAVQRHVNPAHLSRYQHRISRAATAREVSLGSH